jgi:putative SOS response-associated peptidase YedK
MCGRFIQKSERRIITEEFYIDEFLDDVIVSYNLAPGQEAGVVYRDGSTKFARFRWGLVPPWAKDPAIGNRMINARAETLAEKPSFRSAFRSRRCLIPADGFYEWKKEEKRKVPFFVFLKSERPFGLAGLWESWKSPQGSILNSFTIVTTEANASLRSLHDRMPVIIRPEDRTFWLSHKNGAAELDRLLVPYEDAELVYHEVSRTVNSPQNNNPGCIAPVS